MVAVWLRLVVVFELSIRLTLMFSRLVIETLDPLPKDRKCFRMVNGVLVERTIENVLPALTRSLLFAKRLQPVECTKATMKNTDW